MFGKTNRGGNIAAITIVLLAAGLTSMHASARRDTADAQFVADASSSGLAEVRLGELAQQRGSSQAVKDFGKKMVDDHTQANQKLQMIAGKEKKSISATLSDEDRATYAKLNNLIGAEFDRAYAEEMVTDHQKDIADFEAEATHGKDPEVRKFAQDTLPTLKEHLKLAQDMQKAVRTSGGT